MLYFLIKWKTDGPNLEEESWVKTDEIYCCKKLIAFIKKNLNKQHCNNREELSNTLQHFTLKQKLMEEFEKELDIAKYKISEFAAKNMIVSAQEISGQKDSIN